MTMDHDKFLKAVVSIYGENWPAPFSAATGIALRTCQRVKKALDAGETDMRLAGMIMGLEEIIAPALNLIEDKKAGAKLASVAANDKS